MDEAKEIKNQKRCTVEQAKDTAMALVLIGLTVRLNTKLQIAMVCSMGILLIAMAAPKLLLPVARVWFGLSEILGAVVSRIILSFIFVVFVIPIGLARKLAKKDSLRLTAFKKGDGSVFVDRDHRYGPNDLAKPF